MASHAPPPRLDRVTAAHEHGQGASRTASAGSRRTCASRSPTAATCAAPTACRPRDSTGCPTTRCSPTTRWCASCGSRSSSSGSSEVRFTGGEPLVRRGLVDIVRRSAELAPRPELSVTTNALGLSRNAHALAAAGLDRVNVSLDTVRSDTFASMTRRDRLKDVVAGLEAAHDAGLRPVKVNAVLMRGVNDDQAPELLAWCLERGYELRFIEQMPLDAQHGWRRDTMVTAEEILASLRTDLHPDRRGGAAGQRAGRAVHRRRRTGHGRRHRLGHPAVLRRLRPGPAHRRRPGPQLPVRPRGVRPAGAAARRCHRRGDRRPLAHRRRRQAPGPRHRRRDVPPALAADVGHRRLESGRCP